jgi:hypothetical protein
LPSVLCGLALIITCFYVGRRFLSPVWNLGFVAAVTFLPAMILDAQEARMYTFMLTSINIFTLFVFRWEMSGRVRDLAWAVLWMVIAIQFHSLAIFAAFILFFPGLLNADTRSLLHAMAAFGLLATCFLIIDGWVESFFPPRPQVRGVEVTAERHIYADVALSNLLILLPGLLAAGALVWSMFRSPSGSVGARITAGLVLAGHLAQLVLFYHVAFLFLLAGLVLAIRSRVPVRWMLAAGAISVLLAGAHTWMLLEAGLPLNRDLIAALVGVPSPWTYIRFMTYAPGAAAFMVGGAIWALVQLARRHTIRDVWLYAALAIWLPLFLIGWFTWYPQLRYTEASLIPMLLCAFTVGSALLSNFLTRRAVAIAAAAIVCVIVVDPRATASVVNAGYTMHPDHKGAAEYVRSVRQPNDVVLAEDVLQQTYYLGHVDYWLIGAATAHLFSYDLDGREVDIYTHTPVMTSVQQVHELMAKPDRGTIYIIGSGEQQSDGRRHARGEGLSRLLGSGELEVVYRGRDNLTKVWRVPPIRQQVEGLSSDAATSAPTLQVTPAADRKATVQ